MRPFLLILAGTTLFFQACKSQKKIPSRQVFIKEFNWKITIPEGFDTVSASEWTRLQNKGADAVEKTYDAKLENRSKTLFVFKTDQFNYFEANYQPFDTATDGDYKQSCRNVRDIVYETFKAQIPQAELDSSSSEIMIDGLQFHAFNITTKFPNKMVLHMLSFSHLFGKRDFTVNIIAGDDEKKHLMLTSWRNSKFEKQ